MDLGLYLDQGAYINFCTKEWMSMETVYIWYYKKKMALTTLSTIQKVSIKTLVKGSCQVYLENTIARKTIVHGVLMQVIVFPR